MSVLSFIKYNNAVPLVLGVVFFGAASAFAATNPGTVFSQQQTVVSIDNTYIANKDLSSYTPRVEIAGVTEDEQAYYVAYRLSTIDLKDYVWQDITRNESMKVNKDALGHDDLGVYVTARLRNVVGNELAYLRQVQDKEKKNISQKTVATAYGGLVGKFLDENTEVLPGYTPVVAQPAPEGPPQTPADQVAAAAEGAPGSAATPSTQSTPSASDHTALLSLQILGNNPAHLHVGDSYVDLGVVMVDPTNSYIGVHTFVDGHEQVSPVIDTHTPGTHTIEYRATDQAGVAAAATRTVIVEGSAFIQIPVATSTAATSTTP